MTHQAAEYWDRDNFESRNVSWLEDPVIHLYANEWIGAGVPIWPLDWFRQWVGGRRFTHALSIGCGSGNFERQLVELGLVERVDAFDASVVSLNAALAEARRRDFSNRIRYYGADFNQAALPRRRYDLVVFHQSAHHVQNLERLFGAILGALVPSGLLYLDEYVGPSRTEWNDALLAEQRSFYEILPPSLRKAADVPYPVEPNDPSEAVRSSEIERVLRVGFQVLERRPYGGNLLSVLYPLVRQERLTDEIREILINKERQMLSRGARSYYAVIVAQRHRGIRKWLGRLRYRFSAINSA